MLWRDRGPGQWFLEYTYRHRERVLNGFMQSIISLDRFSRQADRLGRSSAEWRALASRARTHVLKGSRALAYWLPTFDLGGGKTRYSLTGGPAPAFYQQLPPGVAGSALGDPVRTPRHAATIHELSLPLGRHPPAGRVEALKAP